MSRFEQLKRELDRHGVIDRVITTISQEVSNVIDAQLTPPEHVAVLATELEDTVIEFLSHQYRSAAVIVCRDGKIWQAEELHTHADAVAIAENLSACDGQVAIAVERVGRR